MSYISGAIALPFTAVGNGTLTTNSGSSTVTVTANASVQPHDLLVLVVYAATDLTLAVDAGEGWQALDVGWDSTNTFSVGMFVCVSTSNGATKAGLTLPASAAWTAQNAAYRVVHRGVMRWNLARMVPSTNWFNASASATALTIPEYRGSGQAIQFYQGIELAGGGYNNGGTTTTVGAPTAYSEQFDTGQASPPHGVTLAHRNNLAQGTNNLYTTTARTLAVAKTNRGSVRGFVPIDGPLSIDGRRYGSSARRVA